MSFQDDYAKQIKTHYPNISASEDEIKYVAKIATPEVIKLEKSVLALAQKSISQFFKLRCDSAYKQQALKNAPDIAKFNPEHFSVLMAYDFHVLPDGKLKLIEINTNGSSSLLVDILFKMHSLNKESNAFHESLKKSFLAEITLSKHLSIKDFFIVDKGIKKQNAYVEFLMFLELFKSWGFNAKLCEPEDFNPSNPCFVYNRLTDFYLSQDFSQNIKKLYLEKMIVLSPNPHEYHLLANKQRLVEILNSANKQALLAKEVIPETRTFKSFMNSEDLWTQRKKFFFKPVESFGGKGAFKGESISKKLFLELFNREYLAQEFVPPGIWKDSKWDLRFYVYKDEIQLAAARIYKGQTTNFQQAGSGLAAVVFES